MRQSNGKWYVRFVVDGVEYSSPTGLEATERNRKAAERMEAAARQLVVEGKSHLLKIEAIPFSDAATQFLSWAEGEYAGSRRGTFLRIRSSFTALRIFLGKAIVSSITEGSVEDYKSYRRKMKIADVSIRHDLHTLSLFFKYAIKKHWARENLVRKVNIPSDKDSVRINILTPAAEHSYFDTCLWMDRSARFIASPDQHAYRDLHDFARLMLQQGCRPEEILELRKEDVDLMNRWIWIRSGKSTAAKRRLKLSTESASILARRSSSTGRFVFPSPRDPQRHRGPTWRVHSEVMAAQSGRVGSMEFVPYDLRHTFATRAVLDGMPLPVLAATLGHANLKSIEKYIHVKAENIDAEMLRIEVLRAGRILAGFLPPDASPNGEQEVKPVNPSGVEE